MKSFHFRGTFTAALVLIAVWVPGRYQRSFILEVLFSRPEGQRDIAI